MTFRSLLLPAVAALLLAPLASAQSPQLKKVLADLDAASAKFHSAQADVRYDNYTKIVDDHALETGNLYIDRSGSSLTMGALFFDLTNGKPNPKPSKVIAFDGHSLQMYSPGVNQVDVFQAGANQAKYESFLTLGFGGSGRDLAKAWNITDQGAETIDGVSTEKLDLVSKDDSVRNTFTHVTIWVDPTRGVSLKQIFYAPHGDNRTALYTNIRLNASINKKPYAISSKANRINH
ncbi:MAG: outer membrane lipoprotein-sorting protein [Acidobacteriota bacterium]